MLLGASGSRVGHEWSSDTDVKVPGLMPKQNPLPLLLGADWVTFLGQLSILPLIILSSWVWTCTAQLTNWLKSQIIHARLMIPLDGCDPTGWMWSHRSLDLMGAHVCGTSEHPACLRSHGAVRSEVRHSVCVCVCVSRLRTEGQLGRRVPYFMHCNVGAKS